MRLTKEGAAVILESLNGQMLAIENLSGNPHIAAPKPACIENNPKLLQTDFILAT